MYGEELDIQVEYIRKRGLSSRRIEALVVSDPTTASRNIHVTEATLDSTGVPTGASDNTMQTPGIPGIAFFHHPPQGTRCDAPRLDGDDAEPRPVTLKELDDPAIRRRMRRAGKLAKNINHAIQKKLNAAQSGIEEPTRSTSVFTGNRAKQLCELIKEVHDHLPKNLTRKEKEILITEGIAERVAYTRFSKMGWKATEQDEFQKIVVNLECLEGPYLMADVRKRCGPEDTIAFLAYVYTRKGIEKDKGGGVVWWN